MSLPPPNPDDNNQQPPPDDQPPNPPTQDQTQSLAPDPGQPGQEQLQPQPPTVDPGLGAQPAPPPKPTSQQRLHQQIDSPQKGSTNQGIQKKISDVIEKAKDRATSAQSWIQSHPREAGLIGVGVGIGTLVLGWVFFRALKRGKDRYPRHARSFDVSDAIKNELPHSGLEKRAVVDEIDWNNDEFLEFLELLPDLNDIFDAELD